MDFVIAQGQIDDVPYAYPLIKLEVLTVFKPVPESSINPLHLRVHFRTCVLHLCHCVSAIASVEDEDKNKFPVRVD